MTRKPIVIVISSLLALGGCANMSETQKGTAVGAGVGAAAGAVLGGVTADHNRGGRTAAGAAIGAVAGGIIGNIWSNRMEEQKRKMEQATQGSGVQVSQTADNRLKLDIPSDISFDVNRAEIKPSFQPLLDKFAQSLNDHQGTQVTIIGHTDSSGSDAINNPLSVARATSARDYLAGRGVAAARVSVDGRGAREPIASNDTVEGRARNRRVEIYVAEPQAPAAQTAPAPAAQPASRGY